MPLNIAIGTIPDVTTDIEDVGFGYLLPTCYGPSSVMLLDGTSGSAAYVRRWTPEGGWTVGSSSSFSWAGSTDMYRANSDGRAVVLAGSSYYVLSTSGVLSTRTVTGGTGNAGREGNYNGSFYADGFYAIVESTDGLTTFAESTDPDVVDIYPNEFCGIVPIGSGFIAYTNRPSNPTLAFQKTSSAGSWAPVTLTNAPNAQSSGDTVYSAGGTGAIMTRGGVGVPVEIHSSTDGISFNVLTGLESIIGVTTSNSVLLLPGFSVDDMDAIIIPVVYTSAGVSAVRGVLYGDAQADLTLLSSWKYEALSTTIPWTDVSYRFRAMPGGGYVLWRDATTESTVHGATFTLTRVSPPVNECFWTDFIGTAEDCGSPVPTGFIGVGGAYNGHTLLLRPDNFCYLDISDATTVTMSEIELWQVTSNTSTVNGSPTNLCVANPDWINDLDPDLESKHIAPIWSHAGPLELILSGFGYWSLDTDPDTWSETWGSDEAYGTAMVSVDGGPAVKVYLIVQSF